MFGDTAPLCSECGVTPWVILKDMFTCFQVFPKTTLTCLYVHWNSPVVFNPFLLSILDQKRPPPKQFQYKWWGTKSYPRSVEKYTCKGQETPTWFVWDRLTVVERDNSFNLHMDMWVLFYRVYIVLQSNSYTESCTTVCPKRKYTSQCYLHLSHFPLVYWLNNIILLCPIFFSPF